MLQYRRLSRNNIDNRNMRCPKPLKKSQMYIYRCSHFIVYFNIVQCFFRLLPHSYLPRNFLNTHNRMIPDHHTDPDISRHSYMAFWYMGCQLPKNKTQNYK